MVKNSLLKIAMFERNMTQERLSEKTGIPRAYISLAVNGRFNFDSGQKHRIASALNCRPEEIFG